MPTILRREVNSRFLITSPHGTSINGLDPLVHPEPRQHPRANPSRSRPAVLPHPMDVAIASVKRTVDGMACWRIEGSPRPDQLHLTRRTRLWRFVDDLVLTFEPTGEGTVIHAESRSRIGKGDLGQNRRNILELWQTIQNDDKVRG